MARRAKGEGQRTREGKYFRYELRVGGRRVVRKAASKEELDRKIREVKQQLENQGFVPSGSDRLLFGEAYELWLQTKIQPRCSPRTLESYRSVLTVHLHPLVKKPLDRIRPDEIQRIELDLESSNKIRTAAYVVSVCSRFFNWCKRQQFVTRNPAEFVDKPPEPKPETRAMDFREIATVLNACETAFTSGQFRYYPVILFCLNTGLRISEALGLRWQADLSPSGNRTVSVVRQLARTESGWELRPTKWHSERQLALNADAQDSIKLAWEQAKTDRTAAREAYQENLFVFANEVGEPAHRSAVYHGFVRVQRAAGIEKPFTVHELRHTFLTHLARSQPLQVAKAIAGHRRLATTERYLKALQEDVLSATAGFTLREIK